MLDPAPREYLAGDNVIDQYMSRFRVPLIFLGPIALLPKYTMG